MRLATILSALLLTGQALAQPPSSFDDAKRAAVQLWWDIGPITFYCHCPYRLATESEKSIRSGNLWVIGWACGYRPEDPVTSSGKPNARALRIEWEHIVPADWIATGFGCQTQTREECRQIPGYNEAEGDLFNLVPAIGELNADRSSRLYGEIDGERRDYGACDFEIDRASNDGAAEPQPSTRGDIARVWFYMADRYGVKMSPAYRTMMESWAASDPVDNTERKRHDAIARVMDRENPFVAGH